MIGLIHRCAISRTKAYGTTGKSRLGQIASNVPCLAIPMSDDTAIKNKFELGQGYTFYFNSTQDVQPADKIAYDGNTYVVRGKKVYKVPTGAVGRPLVPLAR